VRFTGRLEFLEEILTNDPRDRAAGVCVGLAMGKYGGSNAYAQRHFQHYQQNARYYLDAANGELGTYLDGVRVASFFRGDFRVHAKRALERGAGIIAWPPTYKAGYERLYKFVHSNTEWEQPPYDMFDPADLPEWVESLEHAGAKYWVGSDHKLEGIEPAFAYFTGRNRPVYAYATADKTSVRRREHRAEPFKYKPVDPPKLTKSSDVKLVCPDAAQMNFIKDKYLAAGLAHSTGEMNFLVYVDRQLAGGFIYMRSRVGNVQDVQDIYLLSDFAVSRERRISKLIAMLATSRVAVDAFDRAYVQRTKHVTTTAFTDKPVSMKFRGIFDLLSRKPGFLQYRSPVREGTANDIYREWFRKHAGSP
jgi:hypothetical protein